MRVDAGAARVVFWIRSLVAVVAAVAASLTVLLIIVASLGPRQSEWRVEAIGGLFAAAAWMAVGLKIAPRSSFVHAVLFLLGVGTAWVLCRHIVHSTSPYYGLTPVLLACVSSSVVWCAMARDRRARMLSLAIPGLALCGATLGALAWPTLGVTRSVTNAVGRAFTVHIAVGQTPLYVWSTTAVDVDSVVRIEMDPGSGPSEYRLSRVTGTNVQQGCDAFRESSRALVRGEVANGAIPRAITWLPIRLSRCEQGYLYATRQPAR